MTAAMSTTSETPLGAFVRLMDESPEFRSRVVEALGARYQTTTQAGEDALRFLRGQGVSFPRDRSRIREPFVRDENPAALSRATWLP